MIITSKNVHCKENRTHSGYLCYCTRVAHNTTKLNVTLHQVFKKAATQHQATCYTRVYVVALAKKKDYCNFNGLHSCQIACQVPPLVMKKDWFFIDSRQIENSEYMSSVSHPTKSARLASFAEFIIDPEHAEVQLFRPVHRSLLQFFCVVHVVGMWMLIFQVLGASKIKTSDLRPGKLRPRLNFKNTTCNSLQCL